MKLTAPHYSVGGVMHELHIAEVPLVLFELSGPGWIIEFMKPISDETMTHIVRLGAMPLTK